MGADLYIESLLENSRAEWRPQWVEATQRRDSLAEGSAERAEAQKQVEYCYDQMFGIGYFRDPYNDWDLLWKFGLSWWEHIVPMLDEDDQLTVGQAKRLAEMLAEREGEFEKNLATLGSEDETYFRNRYSELREFLRRAIALDEPIECSL